MFRGLLQEHEARVAESQREAEAHRLEAAASAHAVGQAVSEALNAGVQEAYENQKRLETELRALEAQALEARAPTPPPADASGAPDPPAKRARLA